MQSNLEISRELLAFIDCCPSAYHTIDTVSRRLNAEGYTELHEGNDWALTPGVKYFVTRNQSSLLAFRVPQGDFRGFAITASHSDSPTYKLKPYPEMAENGYLKLNTERYGGMIAETWLDRPLSIAGRVVLETPEGIVTRLVQFDRDLLVIPNVAIHLTAPGETRALNPQVDMLPLFGLGKEAGGFMKLLSEELGVSPGQILDTDLFLYCRTPGTIWGRDSEFISSPRLDDLGCVFATLKGFLQESNPHTLPVLGIFDNEEVGSGTKQGAKSTFLRDMLWRVNHGLGYDETHYLRVLAESFMLSCDNGHAVHPNHPEKSDPVHRPKLNGGVLLKYNANQKYTTDAVSGGAFRKLCKDAEVPLQVYVNRSDIPGGSTLGNLSAEKVSIPTVDIGLAQLAMHSAWETAGAEDTLHLIHAVEAFYENF
ncbi:MAG: M18 family aminopeptidase [Clostridia bacterium]|nr:M18 family aminopeptidase [Clostridia bacterium]